jgi:hypothetical protein
MKKQKNLVVCVGLAFHDDALAVVVFHDVVPCDYLSLNRPECAAE